MTLNGHRGGTTYNPALDYERLNDQARRVWEVMKDGRYHTLRDISRRTGDPQASVSARLRDFRKVKFGGHIVNRKRHPVHSGLWGYQLVPRRDR